MQRPSPSTHPHPAALDGRDQACLDARAWLQGRIRWEHRLAELHAVAALGDTARLLETGQRAVRACSGVLEQPGRSAGVRA